MSPVRLLALLAWVSVPLAHASDTNIVPAQFIAKMFTEALGRAPDQPGWSRYVEYFQQHGCDATTLRSVGEEFYTSGQFIRDYRSDNEARVLALYRGALNRDPDQEGLEQYLAQLNAGKRWEAVVDALFSSPEFYGDVPDICSAVTPDYHFGTQVPPTLTAGSAGFSGSEAALQSVLNSAAKGSTVYLAQKAVITLNTTLTVPSGVTLTTYGEPETTSYALMARLVRVSSFDGPNVWVQSDATLTHVWIDGQRGLLGFHKIGGGTADNANVVTNGGANIEISSNRLSNPQGGTNFYSAGGACSNETVKANLVTAYSAVHDISGFSDGLTMACEDLDIEDNGIVDVTDVAIVLFATPGVTQHSRIAHNVIVSAGHSTNAAISADPSTGNPGGSSLDYNGTVFRENRFWTGPYTSFDFGIEAGGRPFFRLPADNSNGSGASYLDNTTGSLSARVRAGIVVAGMLDVTLSNDTRHPLDFSPVTLAPGAPAALCPGGQVIVEASTGNASGIYPPPSFDGDFDGCVNQPFAELSATQVQVTRPALTYSAVTATFNGTVTIENVSDSTLVGPFGLIFSSLTSGVSLVNATQAATSQQTAFLAFPEVLSLAPGESATVPVELSDPSGAQITYNLLVSSGVP